LFGFAWLSMYSFANAPNVRTSRAARFSTTGSPPVGDLALRFAHGKLSRALRFHLTV
jgi:hypothetical protein